jgi:hypothetical protein
MAMDRAMDTVCHRLSIGAFAMINDTHACLLVVALVAIGTTFPTKTLRPNERLTILAGTLNPFTAVILRASLLACLWTSFNFNSHKAGITRRTDLFIMLGTIRTVGSDAVTAFTDVLHT